MDVYGYEGVADSLGGSDGKDYIYGFTGDDAIFGGNGIAGGPNGDDDIIHGGWESPPPPYANYTDNDFIVGDDEGVLGNDQIFGGYGNDIIYADNNSGRSNVGGNDIVYGGTGNDRIVGGSGNDLLYGGEDDDVIYGDFEMFDSGDDYINGGSGNDKMIGGLGYDTYVVDSSGDAVTEAPSQGIDNVEAYINYTLPANVEVLNLKGTVSIGQGNSLDNYIYGNGSDNHLSGEAGNDWIVGGAGSDAIFGGAGFDTAGYSEADISVYVTLSSNGTVRVPTSQGTDLLTGMERIYFRSDYYYDILNGNGADNLLTANANVLSFVYGAGGNDTLIGSIYEDSFAGGSGNDVIISGLGNDNVIGGTGADKFKFYSQAEGIDKIKDFNRSEGDKIQIVKSNFGATSLSQFSYNSTTGALFFGATQLATLENKPTGFSVQTDVVLV